MTSKIGNKKDPQGFTLIEVMVAVSIVALATVMIYQSNVLALDVFNRYLNRLSIQNWAEEKIWEAKEAILQSDFPSVGPSSGEITERNRLYHWQLDVQEVESKEKDLYALSLDVSWQNGRENTSLTRLAYLRKPLLNVEK